MNFEEELEAFQAVHPFKVMDIGGSVFHYLLCGFADSPCTLVYFVGGTGNPLGWYRHVLAMEGKYQVLLLDYPMELGTLSPLIAGIGELLNALKIEKAVFIGASFGGYVAQLMARRYPEKTRAMVLYATTALTEKGIEDLKKQYHYVKIMLWLMEHVPYGMLKALFMKPMLTRMIPKGNDAQAAYLKGFIQWIYRGYTKEADLHMTRLMADIVNLTPVREEDYAYLKDRVFLILPENDKAFTEEMQKDLRKLLQDPETQSVEGGHLATLFRAEEFAQYTDHFLKKIRL